MLFDQARTENLVENFILTKDPNHRQSSLIIRLYINHPCYLTKRVVRISWKCWHTLSRLVACSWVRNVSCLQQGAGRAGRWAGTSQTPNCSGPRASGLPLALQYSLRPELPLQSSQNFWFLRTHAKNCYTLDDLRRHLLRNYKTDMFHTENVHLCFAARIIRSDARRIRFGMPRMFQK